MGRGQHRLSKQTVQHQQQQTAGPPYCRFVASSTATHRIRNPSCRSTHPQTPLQSLPSSSPDNDPLSPQVCCKKYNHTQVEEALMPQHTMLIMFRQDGVL
jgi:hypothetical protein